MFNSTKLMASAILMLSTAFGASAVDHLNIIGGATPGGWNIVDGILMQQNTDNENVFSCIGYLKADEDFKFTYGKDFSDSNKEFRNASTDAYDISNLVQGGDDNKFRVAESANYYVVCNLNDMTISVSKAEYQDNPIRFNALFMVGNATEGGWTPNDGTPLVWGGESDPYKFTWTGELKEGEFKIETNRYNYNAWDGPWYFAGVDGDGNIDYSKIVADGTGDRKWQIAEPGKYNIDIDLQKGSIAINKAGTGGIEGIAGDNTEAPVYYNLQGISVANPSNGIFIKKVGNKVSKVIL